MSKYLGNNYWLLDDGRLLNTARQTLIAAEDVPGVFKYEKTVKGWEVYDGSKFWEMESGRKFVMFDFCENVELGKTKKTTYVEFLKFKTIDITTRKYKSIKENNGFHKFRHYFVAKRSYMLACEINHEFPDSIRILKSIELRTNEI